MSKVLVDQEWLKRLHRDLDACQKVIWLGLRGADPAYCQDAQDRLKEIDELLAQPAEAEGVEVAGYRWKTAIPEANGGGYGWSYASHWSTGPKDAEKLMTITDHLAALSAVTAERDRLRKDAERWRYVSLQGDDTQWLNLLRVDLDEFGGNINAAVDALIDGEAPATAAKEA